MKKWKNGPVGRSVMTAALWIAVLGALASLSACGGKSAGTVNQVETTAVAAFAQRADEMYVEKGEADLMARIPREEDLQNLSISNGSGQPASSDIKSLTDAGRKLIRDVSMNVETKDFESVLTQITSRVSELGGYVESSDVSGISVNSYAGSQQRYADIKARIPADRLDRFVESVEQAGNVTSRQEQVTDVTLQYSDVESHKKSLEIEQERLWALLEKAESLDAVVALESRLSEIRYQLESYTSQLRLYDNQVAYSTVSIYMAEVKDLTPTAPDSIGTRIQKGFTRSLNNLEDAGVGLIIWLAVNSPVLAVLAVIIAAVVFVIRKVNRKMGTKNSPGCRPFHSRHDRWAGTKREGRGAKEENAGSQNAGNGNAGDGNPGNGNAGNENAGND